MLSLVLPIVFAALGILVAVVVVVVAVRASELRHVHAEGAARSFAALGARLGGRDAPGGFQIEVDGQLFTAQAMLSTGLLTLADQRPSGVVISTLIDDRAREPGPSAGTYRSDPRRMVRGRPEVILGPQAVSDRVGARLRVDRVLRSGDDELDARVHIVSSALEEDVRAVLADERVRRAVLEMFALGYSEVRINDGAGRLSAVLQTLRPGDQDPAALWRACQVLRTLSAGLPAFTGPARSEPMWWTAAAAIGVSVLSVLAGYAVLAWSNAEYYPLVDAAPLTGVLLGIPAAVMSLPIVGFLVRGRATSLRVFLIAGAALTIGLPTLGAGLAVGLNGLQDEAAPVERRTVVVSMFRKTKRRGTEYYLRVAAWREGYGTEVLPVPRGLYESLRVGDPVTVVTGPGHFGWEWLLRVERAW